MAALIIETQCKNDTEALMTYKRRIIARREINCNEDEYILDAQCCKKCVSGEYYCKTVEKSVTVESLCAGILKWHEVVSWRQCFILAVSFFVTGHKPLQKYFLSSVHQ